MALLLLSASDVARIIATFSPDELTDLMAQVFFRLSNDASGIHQPHRISVPMTNHTALFMPSRIDTIGTAVKVVSVPTSSAPQATKERGLPASTLVLDETSGGVKAIVNAKHLTALRNAAGSLLATRLLLPSIAQPRSLVAIGAGAQIAAHVPLFLRYFHTITTCTVFNRSPGARVSNLVSALQAQHQNVRVESGALPTTSSPNPAFQKAMQGADLIITATSSTTPSFPSSYVKSGAHLCLIGSYTPLMHEIDTTLVKRAGKVVVDSRAACLSEAGELISAELGPSDLIELGELFEMTGAGAETPWMPRENFINEARSNGDVIIFKSVGVGVQDVAIASAVASRAERENIGTTIDGYDDSA